MGSLLFIFMTVDRVRSSPIILSNSEEIQNLNLSGDFSSGNELFPESGIWNPDTYQDNFGEIQPRIFIADEFKGQEVLTTGRVEYDENDEPYSKVTVITVQDESEEESWFDSFIKKLSGLFSFSF